MDRSGVSRFLRRIASFSRLMIFDKRGAGLSDPVGAAPTFEERMDDIRAVMDACGSERAALIGYSEGGSICALFAATYPERVSSLILYDAWAAGPLAAAGMEGADRWKNAMERVRAMIDHWGDGDTIDWAAPSLAQSTIQRRFWGAFERAAMSPGMARALMDALNRGDVRPALSAISAPTLVLHHPDAPIMPREQGRYLAEHIANARYVELPGPDHAPVGSEMETIADEIQAFLTGTRATARPDRVLVTVLFTDMSSPPSVPRRSVTAAGGSCSSATTRWCAHNSTASLAARSSRPAMGSSPASTVPRGRSDVRARSARRHATSE
jgi:pimeloyl-ACP methyl ester carboxylesterase